MPSIFFFVLFVGAVILGLGLFEVLLLRYLHRSWWQNKIIRYLALSLPVIGLIGFLLFAYGEYKRLEWLSVPSAVVTAVAVILEIALMLSLPVSGMIHLADRLLERLLHHRRKVDVSPPDPARRLILKGIAAAVPAAAVSVGLFGVGRSFAGVEVYLRNIPIDDLPESLIGLRILHLSDLHLRHYVTVHDLAKVLQDAEPFKPDIVVITGDIADELAQLPDALRLVEELNPPMGAYASLGNHEHYRGKTEVRRAFDNSSVPLLVNGRMRIERGNARLLIVGIDDPRHMRGIVPSFFRECLEVALEDVTKGEIVLLMSHRPDVFDLAAERGIHLTLAGHTHGGQVGFVGRSAFETWFPRRYLWGHYKLNRSHLYTSSGVGHWFPFRLGCPPEAPVIELVRTRA